MISNGGRVARFAANAILQTRIEDGGLPYPTDVDGAPKSLEILAMAPAVRFEANPQAGSQLFYPIEHIEYRAAMMAVMTSGKGEVFNSGFCGWMEGLTRGDFVGQLITKNVLDRFGSTS